MKIKKNGKVINLTEGDIKKLNKSLLKESPEDLEKNMKRFGTKNLNEQTMGFSDVDPNTFWNSIRDMEEEDKWKTLYKMTQAIAMRVLFQKDNHG